MAKSEIMQNCPFALLIYINVDIQFNILAKTHNGPHKNKGIKKGKKGGKGEGGDVRAEHSPLKSY
jgi:hypothetical protein